LNRREHTARAHRASTPREYTVSDTVRLCRLAELRDGESRGFDLRGLGRDTIFAVRQAEGVYVWRNACPHDGESPMAWRRHAYLNADRSRIVCNAHGALFAIDTGVCEVGPCVGQRLSAVPVVIDADGFVRVPRCEQTP
jgi:nitrite reductase/ring-hydroxylating ferredoxin subunit